MNKLNPFKPFIVLLVVILYAVIFLLSCGLIGAAMVIPQMPTDKAALLVLVCLIWIGFVWAVISSHWIIITNRQRAAAKAEVNRAV